ncbi:MAG: thioesterase family protein [Proteobacteria bacterium]|nr:thioesterase family protein [Pseudomonadota bacterium]
MHAFDRDIGFVQTSDNVLTTIMSDQWSINHVPNGGYIMAMVTRAMLGDDKKLVACIATANYMERCDPAPAQIFVETIGESRHFIRKQARLVQENKERIRAMATFIKPGDTPLPHHYEKEPEQMAPPDLCLKVPSMGGGYSLFDQVDMRLDPGCAGWTSGTLTDRSVQKGWIRFKEKREIDVPAITFFADCFPPCIFASRGMLAWVPTIEYSVNVRQLPKAGWLRGIFTTRFISSGLVEEDGEIWDEAGSLVAISRQIAKYHPPLN